MIFCRCRCQDLALGGHGVAHDVVRHGKARGLFPSDGASPSARGNVRLLLPANHRCLAKGRLAPASVSRNILISSMNERRPAPDSPLKLPVQPITEFARDQTPPPKPRVPIASAADSKPPSRSERARSSASPEGAVIPRSRLIPVAEKERRSRSRRRRRRDTRRRRKSTLLVVSLVCGLALTSGFLWAVVAERNSAVAGTKVSPVAPGRQEEALRLLDEAVKAKYEKRYDDALAAAAAARKADPNVAGIDVLVGGIALEQGQPDVMQRAASEALVRGQDESAANLLLALHKWMLRGAVGGAAVARVAVSQFLSEAADAEMSKGDTFFFWGEMERHAGREDSARTRILGGLHRMQPWHSSDIISAKMQLAADDARASSENGMHGELSVPSTPIGNAVVDLRRALQSSADARASLAALRGAATGRQLTLLLGDQAFAGAVAPDWIEQAEAQSAGSIPLGKIPPPQAAADAGSSKRK